MLPLPIAVLGATGSVGEALLLRLSDSSFAHADISAFASRATRKETVSFGDRSLPVRMLAELHDVGPVLAFNALPSAVGRKVALDLLGHGCFVVDVGNGTAGTLEAPLLLPALGAPSVADMAAAGAVRTPTAAGWLVATALAPLLGVGATGVTATINLPATAYGVRGSEELSEQVIATFNLKDPPRRIFPEGLAFDTLPEDVDAGEWSERELLASAEVSELLGIKAERCAITCCTQPVFAGMTASLYVRGTFSVEEAEQALRGALGLQTATQLRSLRPRKVMGRAPVYWSSVRADPGGDGVHLWLAADNLTGAGAAVPVALAEAVLAGGLLSRAEA